MKYPIKSHVIIMNEKFVSMQMGLQNDLDGINYTFFDIEFTDIIRDQLWFRSTPQYTRILR